MKVDTHEPSEAFTLLQSAIPALLYPLNDEGYADFLWSCFDNSQVQAERKTWLDLLGDLNAVEDQLRRQMRTHPEVRLMLIAEGIALPGATPTVGTQVFKRAKSNERILVSKGNYSKGLNLVYAWLYQVSKYIEVYFTADLVATCTALTAFYNGDQKEEHHTFHRYLKQVTFHPNPQVKKLMGMAGGLGPARAEALIKEFGTIWGVLSAQPERLRIVDGIGPKLANKILREAGRPDV